MTDQKNKQLTVVRGIITEALPSTLFRLKIEDVGAGEGGEEKEILAYLSGKMRMHRIKVLVGDQVEVILDPYGGKGRIVKRF
ncbi:translation initiation factor IF-1 [Candidatus Nomurabacteria bacterium]|nr:translation initiation factor IF-1 [Candidatus Nomurabacteria bacterium]